MRRWVVHYGEIGIKGDNRTAFETRLARNIRRALGDRDIHVQHEFGRLVLDAPGLAEARVAARLAELPGIVHFAHAATTPLALEAWTAEALRQAEAACAGPRPPRSFRIQTRRSNKSFPMTSVEINRRIGAAVAVARGLKVDLEAPDLTIWLEVAQREALLYTVSFPGVGGLPVGMAGRVVVLLSGGIDSPVAAYKLIRRGAEAVLVHFHNYTRDEERVRDKILDLARTLARYQQHSRLWLVPFAAFQEALIGAVPAESRMIAYRRAMLRLAGAIAAREGALALVTGDSVGQVASQTLDNLRTAYAAAELPVLTPLIGEDKTEIMALARRIGSYDISTRPYEDCCSYLVARHPRTRSRIEALLECEGRIAIEALGKEALDAAEVLDLSPAS